MVAEHFTMIAGENDERTLQLSAAMNAAWVYPWEEAGAARRANRALTVGALKGDAAGDESIDVWPAQLRIVQCADGVAALLIGANSKDVWRH